MVADSLHKAKGDSSGTRLWNGCAHNGGITQLSNEQGMQW